MEMEMNMSEHGNPRAFPSAAIADFFGGMTLRDWFAGQALAGLSMGCAGLLGGKFSAYAEGACNEVLADRAFVLADLMLAERAK